MVVWFLFQQTMVLFNLNLEAWRFTKIVFIKIAVYIRFTNLKHCSVSGRLIRWPVKLSTDLASQHDKLETDTFLMYLFPLKRSYISYMKTFLTNNKYSCRLSSLWQANPPTPQSNLSKNKYINRHKNSLLIKSCDWKC